MDDELKQIQHGVKKFKPRKTPRYLPGDASPTIRDIDLKIYNMHLLNIFNCKPYVDARPPYIRPLNYTNPAKLFKDSERLAQIQKNNKELICKMNVIYKTKGDVDCWNTFKWITPKWVARQMAIKDIMDKNENIYKRIKNTKPVYNHKDNLKDWKKVLRRMIETCRYPLAFTTNKTVDELIREQPSISGNFIHYGYKPRVFINFKLGDGSCLGEIIIQLYPDFCPKTVKNFLTYCNPDNEVNYKNCRIFNAKHNKFFEIGDVTTNNGKGGTSIYGRTFQEEPSILRHSRPGVVSTVRIRENGKLLSNSKFCITVCTTEELQNRCTVFGKVTKGNHILKKMNGYFKRAGPPVEPIFIKHCGIVPPTKQEIKMHKELQFEES